MRQHSIISTRNQAVLFQGIFSSFKDCLEQAVLEKTNLDYADLRQKNLTNANLDGAQLRFCTLQQANLTGTNLSETNLEGANFQNASLFNTCLADSILSHCDFRYAFYGATDVSESYMTHAHFTPERLSNINLKAAKNITPCYLHIDKTTKTLTSAPFILLGLSTQDVVMNEDGQILSPTSHKNSFKNHVKQLQNTILTNQSH